MEEPLLFTLSEPDMDALKIRKDSSMVGQFQVYFQMKIDAIALQMIEHFYVTEIIIFLDLPKLVF